MAKKELTNLIINLFSKLGGNMNNVLGSRSNITFLGKGKNPEGFIDSDINVEAIGVLGKSKILDELESSMGYLTAGKLNDVQAGKLYENMTKIDEVFNPRQIPNITDLGTGTRDLTQEGLASLRSRVDDIDLPEGVDPRDTILPSRMIDDLPPPGSRGDVDDIAAPFQDAETTIANLEKQDPKLAEQFRNIFLSNQGGTPSKRATAREFLVEALKKENPNQTSLADIIDEVDVKYITEGGGGIGGDPLILVEKYFGPRIRELIPEGASSEEIAIFTQRVLNNVVDAAGNKPNSPDFDRFTARILDIDMPGGPEQPFADGGRVGLRFGSAAGKAFGLFKKKQALEKGITKGYADMRKYGIEGEDITNMFKEISMDPSLVGPEKTEYFKVLNQALKNPSKFPDTIKEIQMKLGIEVGTGFKSGGLAKILEV